MDKPSSEESRKTNNYDNQKSDSKQDSKKTDINDNEMKKSKKDTFMDKGRWRDLVAYWLLGLCNNFGFIVMLTGIYVIFTGVLKRKLQYFLVYE